MHGNQPTCPPHDVYLLLTGCRHSQHKVLVPHRVQGLGFDLCHLDGPGGQHLLGAGALLQLLLSLPEAELPLLFVLCVSWALADQDSQHAVGVAVPCRATGDDRQEGYSILGAVYAT